MQSGDVAGWCWGVKVRSEVVGEGWAKKPSGVVAGDASGLCRGMMKGGEV